MRRYLAIMLILLAAAALVVAGRQASIAPSVFSHGSHGDVSCIDCHHDWPETRATERCKGCHMERPDLRARAESQFHALCRGCHAELAPGQAAPTAQCSSCHRASDAPPWPSP